MKEILLFTLRILAIYTMGKRWSIIGMLVVGVGYVVFFTAGEAIRSYRESDKPHWLSNMADIVLTFFGLISAYVPQILIWR